MNRAIARLTIALEQRCLLEWDRRHIIHEYAILIDVNYTVHYFYLINWDGTSYIFGELRKLLVGRFSPDQDDWY